MITYSSDQVINKAAADLGKWVPGEALGGVEHDTISNALDAVLAEITKIIAINDRDEVPDFAFECVATLTAIFASSEFSNVPVDRSPGGQFEMIERRLRYLVAQAPTYEPLQAYYF